MAAVVVTGASGFLGSWFLKEISPRHPEGPIVALVRNTPLGFSLPSVQPMTCDLRHENAVQALVQLRPKTLVHMASAILEPDVADRNERMLRHVLAACQKTGARLLSISSSQVLFARKNEYARSKVEGETVVRASGIPFTILRPASPYAPPLPDHCPGRAQSMAVLVSAVKRSPVVPIIGNGTTTRQPLHVRDLCSAMEAILEQDRFLGETFDLGGPQVFSMDQIVATLARCAGKQVFRLHLPKGLCLLASHILSSFNRDLLATVDCDERVDNEPILNALGMRDLIQFEQGARELMA